MTLLTCSSGKGRSRAQYQRRKIAFKRTGYLEIATAATPFGGTTRTPRETNARIIYRVDQCNFCNRKDKNFEAMKISLAQKHTNG
jgi:hypothetical protein